MCPTLEDELANADDIVSMQAPPPAMIEIALGLARHGKPVFPCSPVDKKPLTARDRDKDGKPIPGTGGLKKASTDITQVKAWWTENPTAMVAIPTGEPIGVWVLEIDISDKKTEIPYTTVVAQVAAIEAELGARLPPTVRVKTPRGGEHWYYKSETDFPRNSQSIERGGNKLNGIDVRGDGGYVIAAGSRRSDGRVYDYVDRKTPVATAPAELVDWACGRGKWAPPRRNTATTGNGSAANLFISPHENYARRAFEAEIAALATAPEGSRNERILKTASGLASFVPHKLLTESEIRTAIENIIAGWDNPAKSRETMENGIRFGLQHPRERPQDEERSTAATDPKAQPTQPKPPPLLKSTRASTYKLSAIQWLWPDRFALGKLGIIAGLPDEGKGQVFCDMAARVTRGSEWPCGEGMALKGNVILLSAEDAPEDTVVPRLLAAGADLDAIEIVSMVRDNDKDRMFSLITDLALLKQKVADVGNVKLIQIDPMSAYLGAGKIDSFRTTDVRAVLAPVVDLATELKVAIVGIMHFNKKTDVTNALLRISDSLAFGATARHVFAVVNDPDNKRKLFVKGKNNLARSDIKSLAYEFGLRQVGHDPDTDQEIWAPHIVWQPNHVDVTASEAMQATTESKSPAARDEAKSFLASLLSSGPLPSTDVHEAADADGVTRRTLFRAKRELGVVARKDAPNGGWTWRLPDQPKRWNE